MVNIINNDIKSAHSSTSITSAVSVTNLSFKNDDYNYLINNNDLIITCREALLENEGSGVKFTNSEDYNLLSSTSSGGYTCDNSLGDGVSDIARGSKVSSTLDNVSIKEFSKWLSRTEEHLQSVCYCSFRQGNVNLNSSTTSQNASGEWIDAISQHKVIQAEIQSVGRRFINSLTANANKISKSLLKAEETRWHNLWLKSFECLMIIEELNTCPNHTAWNRERTSTPYNSSKRFKFGPFSEGKENIRGMMKNRRIQTNMIGIGAGPGLNETFNVPNGKFEIIHKDIGYSSDADMSDACEPTSCPNYISSNAKSPRKRHRRRRPRVGERPWSFHSEWTGWDYYQPPLGFSGEYRSSEDLNLYEDENLVRSLTEFGENYERWFETDDGLLKGKASDFITSSPNITCSSFNGANETTSSLDITDILPITVSGKKTGIAKPLASSTFIIKDLNADDVAKAKIDDIDADANSKADVYARVDDLTFDISSSLPPPPPPSPQLSASPSPVNQQLTDSIAMNPALKTFPTSIYYSSSTQTSSLLSSTTSTSSLTFSTPTTTTTTKPLTSTKYFFIYLTITLLMAFILSLLVATLSTPMSPHVQKSYPNRSPPN